MVKVLWTVKIRDRSTEEKLVSVTVLAKDYVDAGGVAIRNYKGPLSNGLGRVYELQVYHVEYVGKVTS